MAWAAGLAVVLVVGTVRVAAGQGVGLGAGALALVVTAALVTVGLRRHPLGALAGAMLTVSGYLLAGYPYGPVQVCMVIAMFEVARRRPLRTSAVACGLAAVLAAVTILLRSEPAVHEPLLLAAGWTGWVVLPWSVGALLHVTGEARERARRELVDRTAAAERIRLAGAVHDVAGHGFALVAMHAGIALLVLEEDAAQARASLEAIKATSDASLAELRGMLDAFHPRPAATGLARLGALVDEVRTAGLPVGLTLADVTLTAEADAVAYRVVQESLTNVLRHAGPTTADVRVGPAGGDVLVEVTDYGGTGRGAAAGGRGLAGLRDTVEAAGGRFTAGPTPRGGFQVTARLPMGGAA
ncbi:histidine kinase [Actinoplanes sp. N902-109]|nr:histidine kinase [Actinoplanes sp. N902-109]